MEEKIVHVVMLNWNQPQLTIDSIESLSHQKDVMLFFIIVDNGSTDNSVNILRDKFPRIMIIENSENLGFAKANNIGIKKALELNAKNILLINNDIIADPLMVSNLLAFQDEQIGIVAPIIYYADSPEKIWSLGGNIHPVFLDLMESQEKGFVNQNFKKSTSIKREFMPSCAWLVRRDIIDVVGFLDERFFIYYDDIDYCLRLKKQGYGILIIPNAKLWHKVSMASGGQYSPRERYFMAKSSGQYFKKYLNFWNFIFILPFRFFSAIKWTIKLLIRGNLSALSSYWKGLLEGWLNNPIIEK